MFQQNRCLIAPQQRNVNNVRQPFLPPRIPHEQQIGSKSGQNQMMAQNSQLKRNRSPSPPQNYYKTGNSQQFSHPPSMIFNNYILSLIFFTK